MGLDHIWFPREIRLDYPVGSNLYDWKLFYFVPKPVSWILWDFLLHQNGTLHPWVNRAVIRKHSLSVKCKRPRLVWCKQPAVKIAVWFSKLVAHPPKPPGSLPACYSVGLYVCIDPRYFLTCLNWNQSWLVPRLCGGIEFRIVRPKRNGHRFFRKRIVITIK